MRYSHFPCLFTGQQSMKITPTTPLFNSAKISRLRTFIDFVRSEQYCGGACGGVRELSLI